MTQNYTRSNKSTGHKQQKIKSSRGYYNQTWPQTCKQWESLSLSWNLATVFRTSALTIVMLNVIVKCTHVPKVVKHGPIVGSPRATNCVCVLGISSKFHQTFCNFHRHYCTLWQPWPMLSLSYNILEPQGMLLGQHCPMASLKFAGKTEKIGTLFYIDWVLWFWKLRAYWSFQVTWSKKCKQLRLVLDIMGL